MMVFGSIVRQIQCSTLVTLVAQSSSQFLFGRLQFFVVLFGRLPLRASYGSHCGHSDVARRDQCKWSVQCSFLGFECLPYCDLFLSDSRDPPVLVATGTYVHFRCERKSLTPTHCSRGILSCVFVDTLGSILSTTNWHLRSLQVEYR